MLASMKRQFTELLSDIGFVREGLTVRKLERMTRDGNDGVIAASGPEVVCHSERHSYIIKFFVIIAINAVLVFLPISGRNVCLNTC